MTDEDILLLNAYRDGELSPGEALAMERRLTENPELRAQAQRLEALSNALRGALAGAPVPSGLRGRIIQKVGFRDGAPGGRLTRFLSPLAATLLVGLAGGVLLGSGTTFLAMNRPGAGTSGEILSAHLRAMMAPQPFDVASSNRHVVKPWFNGKTTIAPDAVDLGERGFPLAGGRVDVIDGRPAPTLVYRRGPHVISVTALPRSELAFLPERESRAGFSFERWAAGDLAYVAVSDIAPADLRTFVDAFRAEAAPPAKAGN